MSPNQSQNDELSDSDLERVAAGKLVKATFLTSVEVNASLLSRAAQGRGSPAPQDRRRTAR